MGRPVLFDRNYNEFYKDMVERETIARMQWLQKYGPQIMADRKEIEEEEEIVEKSTETLQDKIAKRKKDLEDLQNKIKYYKIAKAEKDGTMKELEQRIESLKIKEFTIPQSDMRPVTPEVRETLYHGISKQGQGRSEYLGLRNKKNPDVKYDYPVISSWDYGWRLLDLIELKPAQFGRHGSIMDTFYRRNGVFDSNGNNDCS